MISGQITKVKIYATNMLFYGKNSLYIFPAHFERVLRLFRQKTHFFLFVVFLTNFYSENI